MAVKVPLAVLSTLAILMPMCLVPSVNSAAHRQVMGVQSYVDEEILISEAPTVPVTDRHQADVAWSFVRDQYLVVWHNTWPGSRDIYAWRVTRDGTIPRRLNIPCPGNCLQPSLMGRGNT